MNKKIRKAVIPVAGLGTRFLPATKTVPKELLPIVDKPILLFIVEECVRAGIEDIVFISGRGKSAIVDYFDTSYELETLLQRTGKTGLLDQVSRLRKNANFISIRQQEALGLGHAVYCAHSVVGQEPFAVLLGDEIMVDENGEGSGISELCEHYKSLNQSVVAVMKVQPEEVEKYGMVAGREEGSFFKVSSVVEKPGVGQAPSLWALPGRYVFDAALFDYLRETRPGKNGEIQLTDGMTQLAQNQGLWATPLQSRRYDAGDKWGYLQANIELGLLHPEVGPKLKQYLNQRLKHI